MKTKYKIGEEVSVVSGKFKGAKAKLIALEPFKKSIRVKLYKVHLGYKIVKGQGRVLTERWMDIRYITAKPRTPIAAPPKTPESAEQIKLQTAKEEVEKQPPVKK